MMPRGFEMTEIRLISLSHIRNSTRLHLPISMMRGYEPMADECGESYLLPQKIDSDCSLVISRYNIGLRHDVTVFVCTVNFMYV